MGSRGQLPAQVNQPLEIEVGEGKTKRKYPSFLVESAPGAISVAAPMQGGELVPLPAGTGVMVVYSDTGGLYAFPAKVTAMRPGKTAVLVLQPTGAGERAQRRDFVRLDILLPVRYGVLPEPSVIAEPAAWRMGKARDISGGGLLLSTTQSIEMQTWIALDLALPGGLALRTTGRVVRAVEPPALKREPGVIWYGVQFSGMERRLQDRLVRFIFDEQLKLRRKGLI